MKSIRLWSSFLFFWGNYTKWFFGPHRVDTPGNPALWKGLQTCVFECICECVWVFVYAYGGMTQWRWEGKTFPDPSFFTMRVPAGVAAVSHLCPLVGFLCVVSQSCYGTRVDLSPHANPNPSLYPNPRLKSLPEPTPLPRSSPDTPMSQLKPSQLLSSSQNLWSKSQLKPRLDTMSHLTNNHRSNTNIPSAISQATSSSNTGLRLQPLSKQGSNSRQGLAFKSDSNQLARSNSPKQSSKINPKTNPKARLGSLSQSKAKGLLNSKAVTGSKTDSESVFLHNTKLSSIFSPTPWSNSSGSMDIYSNGSPASLSNPKSHSKLRPSSQTNPNARSDSKISNSTSKTSIRAQRNQTKLLDTDKDFHQRPKRGWIWNQFFVLEEHIGPEPQYVGKVRYLLIAFFLWSS